jgi:Tol biopolymer transport system component
MMRSRLLTLFNGIVGLATIVLLLIHFSSPPVKSDLGDSPRQADFTRPDQYLAYVIYPAQSETTDTLVKTSAFPLTTDKEIDPGQSPKELFSQAEPSDCQTDDLHVSPNGRYLLIQYNCHATLFMQLLKREGETAVAAPRLPGYFLNWSPDGNQLIVRDTDNEQIILLDAEAATTGNVSAAQESAQTLSLPFGVYNVTFSPDGQSILFAANKGLGFGSELGTYTLANDKAEVQQTFPDQIVAYPRWSPDGKQMSYILMLDSNRAYTIGELWLADATGKPLTLLAENADAGHGYPPVWSPQGQSITYIVRENPDSLQANYHPLALHSNIYQVDVSTGTTTPLTTFEESLVYDIQWSGEGDQIAFTANDAIWTLIPGEDPVQVSQPGDEPARHPVWLPGSE